MGYRYLGSKARVVENIIQLVGSPRDYNGKFIDAFCGTGIVASRAADIGWNVHINDIMINALIMSESRLLSVKDVRFQQLGGYDSTIEFLNELNGQEGFITREYSPVHETDNNVSRKYFTIENAMKIDAITQMIHKLYLNNKITTKEKTLLLSDLVVASNNVANIAGTYGCFLSKWSPPSRKQIKLAPRKLRDEAINYSTSNIDVFSLTSKPEDVVYFDPPYTKRQYASYYHIPETICIGDEPPVEGISGLRPWKDRASVFCYKTKAMNALTALVRKQDANTCFISYSDDGHIELEPFVQILSETGTTIPHQLDKISRYNSHSTQNNDKIDVREYLIEYHRD